MSTVDEITTHKLIASDTECRQAQLVVDELSTRQLDHWVAAPSSGTSVALPPELSGLLTTIVQTVSRGGTVTVAPMPEEVTTTTAAQQLGLSRPTLMKMIAKGEIASHKVGTHTRLKSVDVAEFKRSRLARQRQAFTELLELEDQD